MKNVTETEVYQNIEADEKIIFLLEKHWISKLGTFTLSSTLLILGIVGLVWALLGLQSLTLLRYVLMLGWFWLLWVFYFWLTLFLRWKSDIYIVTNERIIDLEANSLTYKLATDFELSHAESVQYASSGGVILGGIDYGTVTIQWVGSEQGLVMRDIPQPAEVARVIGELAEASRKREGGQG
jgi:hypothetical protein